MNIFQKALSTIWPPYRHNWEAEQTKVFLKAISTALPTAFEDIKLQLEGIGYPSLKEKLDREGFRFLMCSYSPELDKKFHKREINFNIIGIDIYCNRTNQNESFEIGIRDNLPLFWKCSLPGFDVTDFDLKHIECGDISKVIVTLPPSELELLLASLEPEVRAMIDIDDLNEIEYNNRTYYGIYDFGTGDCIAFNKKGDVYSCIHDARPAVTKMKISLGEMLKEIAEGRFNSEAHLDERYRKSK